MLQYLVRRMLWGLLTLLLITFVIYGLIRFMPGDPALLKLYQESSDKKITAEQIEQQRKMYGLDQPFYIAYVKWLGDVLTGNLQTSFAYKAPVSSVIGERIGRTLMLTINSLILEYLLAIPLGLYFTARSSRLDERSGSMLLFMLYSLPSFCGALFLQLWFAVYLEWLPLHGMQSDNYEQLSTLGKTWDLFKHALLPVAAFTYGGLAYYSRFLKATMNETVRQDYIRTARAKGIGPLKVLCWHAFRNSLIPLVTQIGLTLPALLSGAIILERIFSWPGIGTLFFQSILERDYPIIMGLVLMFSILTLLGQLLADVLYAFVDPRVSYK
ncbi:MAG: ABC transporter permease [Planctomycetia bacterium]|nr:ABC transporter permease [Planctomycetia bacterium]